jgi:hypothetical protein
MFKWKYKRGFLVKMGQTKNTHKHLHTHQGRAKRNREEGGGARPPLAGDGPATAAGPSRNGGAQAVVAVGWLWRRGGGAWEVGVDLGWKKSEIEPVFGPIHVMQVSF